jgi:hypothetical protein
MSSSSSAAPDAPVDISSGTTDMVNHARTLLLNKDGAERPPTTYFGEEVVPMRYAAVALPSTLRTVQRALFGGTPDDAGLNYMLWQYMRVLHSTEFVEYVLDLGDRITYMYDHSLLNAAFGPSVQRNPKALQFTGQPDLGGTSGQLIGSWSIVRNAPTSFTLKNLQTGKVSSEFPTVTDGMTDYMSLPGHKDYKVRVIGAYATETSWLVEYLAKPGIELDIASRAAQVNNIGAAAYADLFPSREPFKTFQQLWDYHMHLPYKLSGALLAMIYRTEELRSGR